MPGVEDVAVEEVVSAVARSKKYRTLCRDTVARIAACELAHRGSVKDATKATKRRLHQIYGAFETDLDYDLALARLAAAYGGGSGEAVRRACRDVLARHHSTRERLPLLDDFYPALWAVTGRPDSVLDVGCGLHPLALPWMDLAPGARYVALDVDRARIDFLNRFLALAALAPLARCQDALAHPPADEVDVALLLKMSPTLERQEQGATPRLIGRLRARHVVVSFAVQSLGGRDKGMADHYRRQFGTWAADRQWQVAELPFDAELVFVLQGDG